MLLQKRTLKVSDCGGENAVEDSQFKHISAIILAIKTDYCTKTETDAPIELGKDLRSLEERRRSLLDHHWAIPSKERYMFYRAKFDYTHTL